jgi:hypothetical protein
MAHWAEIDENNIVVQVVKTSNDEPDEGYQWLMENLGGRWIKTSYNSLGGVHYLPDEQRDENGNLIPSGQSHLRYNYAGIGYTYDENRDAFIPIKRVEFKDWVLDEATCRWKPTDVE